MRESQTLPQPQGVLVLDTDTMVARMSPALGSRLGYPEAESAELPLEMLVADNELPLLRAALADAGADEFAASGAKVTYLSRRGEPLPMWTIVSGTGKRCTLHVTLYEPPDAVVCNCVDSVLKDVCAGILLTDSDLNVLSINRAFSQITGYAERDIVGKTPRLLQSGRHKASFYRHMWRAIKRDGCWHGEIWNRRKNGDVYPERLSISTIRDNQNRIRNYVGFFYDISDEVSQREELDELANKDLLTGLPNRHAFLARLEEVLRAARRAGRRVALLFVDLDNFKDINDSHGHAAGDHVLEALAMRLQGGVRASDYLARWGGDEMVVLLGDDGAIGNVAAVAQKIVRSLGQPVQIDDALFHVTVSVGIALFPEHASTSSELIDRADEAMYRAKWAGRNGYAMAEE